MTTAYPAALDAFTNPTATDKLNSPSHAGQHANANDAIEAIEATLGVNPQGGAASVSARIAAVEGGGGGVSILAAIARLTGISPQFTAPGSSIMVTANLLFTATPTPGDPLDAIVFSIVLRDSVGATVDQSAPWGASIDNQLGGLLPISHAYVFATTPGTVYDVQMVWVQLVGVTTAVDEYGGVVLG